MNYRYKKNQIFRKKLNVPKEVLFNIYNNNLFFNDFIKYDLEDKIPLTCINKFDLQIVNKFGMEKSKKLDWELINTHFRISDFKIKDFIMSINNETENINDVIYEKAINNILPIYYSKKMKEKYPNRFFEIKSNDDILNIKQDEIQNIKNNYNYGKINLEAIIKNWNILSNMNFDFCLKNDSDNKELINDKQLNEFMSIYGKLSMLICKNTNIYSFIDKVTSDTLSLQEKNEYINNFFTNILNRSVSNRFKMFKDSTYREIFKFISLKEFLRKYNEPAVNIIFEELDKLPEDFIYTQPFKITSLMNSDTLCFIKNYGFKNIVDFDNECGHFFSNNDDEMLNSMFDMYLNYACNIHNNYKTIYTKNYDKNGKYVDRLYTKEEFYEAMRRMIIYGPTNGKYMNNPPKFDNIIGPFKKLNPDLFISNESPEELKKMFYTKSIEPKLIKEHPEYISYLKGRNLEACFKNVSVKIYNNKGFDSKNLYNFLSSKMDYNALMTFISRYSDILEIINDPKTSNYIDKYKIVLSQDDDITQIKDKICDTFKIWLIEKEITYPNSIPNYFKKKFPELFLNSNVPLDLQNALYNRKINSNYILKNLNYKQYLKCIDLELIYKYMPICVNIDKHMYEKINLVKLIKEKFDKQEAFDLMLSYGKYIESSFDVNKLNKFNLEPNFSKEDLLNEIDSSILQAIIDGEIKYDDNISNHFKQKNPSLFLNDNLSKEFKDKFYNRQFNLKDFQDNHKLLEMFDNTNIICGFSEEFAWMIPVFKNNNNQKNANLKRLKLISSYIKINDVLLQNAFKEYILEYDDEINFETIEHITEVLSKLSMSNSSEIFKFRKELAVQILKSDDPISKLNKIENIFIKNNIPTIGKIYSCFEILHPDFKGFDFSNSTISPVLKSKSTRGKKVVVFSDLIKISFGSNNRSINSYIKNIEFSSKIYEQIKNNQIKYDNLDIKEKNELKIFRKHLFTLYNNTLKGKSEKEEFIFSEDIISDISSLSKKISLNGTSNYDLADRIISMFCHFAGIDTLSEAKAYINNQINNADERNRNISLFDMDLKQGDFIKGINDIKYLGNILQNGSVSKEYLGSDANSDATPLDTDVSIILDSSGTNEEKINKTEASKYRNIWLVLKNDNRFFTTRTSNGDLKNKYDSSKMEVFYTGATGNSHYGIRTGFASTEINYIIASKYTPKIGLEIAMNGFYIPVYDINGKIVFTSKDYDILKSKMSGLSYYDENNFEFSNNLISEETSLIASQIENNNFETKSKRTIINEIIQNSVDELGLQLKNSIDGDLTEGSIELIDTGSTGRGTNNYGDGDFDFMMRLDKNILSNPEK